MRWAYLSKCPTEMNSAGPKAHCTEAENFVLSPRYFAISSGLVLDGSYVTTAVPLSLSAETFETPSTLTKAASTSAGHPAHVMPVTLSVTS